MSIDPNELRRLHEAATPGEWLDDGEGCITADRIPIVEYPLETRDGVLIAYLRNHVPDILAALTDRKRLVEALVAVTPTHHRAGECWCGHGVVEHSMGCQMARAALYAARSAK
jgi:hypothetical protein